MGLELAPSVLAAAELSGDQHLPFTERLEQLRDPELRRTILAEEAVSPSSEGTR